MCTSPLERDLTVFVSTGARPQDGADKGAAMMHGVQTVRTVLGALQPLVVVVVDGLVCRPGVTERTVQALMAKLMAVAGSSWFRHQSSRLVLHRKWLHKAEALRRAMLLIVPRRCMSMSIWG